MQIMMLKNYGYDKYKLTLMDGCPLHPLSQILFLFLYRTSFQPHSRPTASLHLRPKIDNFLHKDHQGDLQRWSRAVVKFFRQGVFIK